MPTATDDQEDNMGMKPRPKRDSTYTSEARRMVAHGLVQGYLNDMGGETLGHKIDADEEALVLAIAIALGHAHNVGARSGWMRAVVYHVDMDAEGSPKERAEINRRWPL